MNVKEIRDKSNDELLKALDESKKELFDLRFEGTPLYGCK